MQQRAARTQEALIHAAAVEFDRRGYEGASLARISKGAQASMGALTFHFRTKGDLARAVRAQGRAALVPVVRGFTGGTGAPLETLAGLTAALVRLMERDVVVRAAVRLERDGPREAAEHELSGEWVPALRMLLERAAEAGQLRPDAPPVTVAALLTWLVEGSWVEIGRAGPGPCGTAGRATPEDVWDLVLYGVSGTGRPGPAGEAPR
ncbi:TetR family transcriptional regulator [Streptomyces sp. PRKS01-65]|nr:TetR/AcrR family transcriptional regulator [Streptomyces harenosi]NEY34753.1 TetR family transcriptional regulator [Streptomyces harenosi]